MVELDTASSGPLSSGPLSSAAPADVQATFCATLVDQWICLGVRHAVVAPGSRSTPMAVALAERDEMAVHVVHDERAAAFTALGLAVDEGSTGSAVPALLLCTSGTAAANFFPAVVEAGLSEIPMIVLTADRPEELRGVGAPQTIDQIELYGRHVRWFHDPGVPDASDAGEWRRLAVSARDHSTDGPVQLNLPFREPLLGTARRLPPRIEVAPSVQRATPTDAVPDGFGRERGVILVGGRHGVDPDRVLELRRVTGWPVIADPTSGMRHLGDVTTVDALLRSPSFVDTHRADVIVRVGRPSTSKVLAQWTARPGVTLIQVGGPGRIDPAGNVAAVCAIDDLVAAGPATSDTAWLTRWRRAQMLADDLIDEMLASPERLSEPAVARVLARNVPAGSQVTVSSSMPVRDFEWFGGHTAHAHANRGANGIDGVVSTALGRVLADPEDTGCGFVLIGDLAFVHDSNALVGMTRRGVDLRIVVVDNDGGGIFSFLPQAAALEPARFEQLFGTPLGTDVLGLAAAHGLATATAHTHDELVDQIGRPGPWVCRVPSERVENVRTHREIHEAIEAALESDIESRGGMR